MIENKVSTNNRQIIKWIIFILILFTIGYLIYFFNSLLSSLFIGFLIAYILDPVVDWFEKKKISRVKAILILMLMFLFLFLILFIIVIPSIFIQLKELISQIPGILVWFNDRAFPWIENKFHFTRPSSWSQTWDQIPEDYRNKLQNVIPRVWGPFYNAIIKAFSSGVSLITGILNLFLIPFFAYFLLKDYDKIINWIKQEIPPLYRDPIVSFFKDVDITLASFIRGQLTVMFVMVILYSVGLRIVGIKLAIVIGLLTGLLNIIPYVGVATGLILSILMALLGEHIIHDLIGIGIVFGLIQIMDGIFITPKIVGDKVGLNPLIIVIALMIGGQLGGIIGMLVSVPSAAILKILALRILSRYHKSSTYNSLYIK